MRANNSANLRPSVSNGGSVKIISDAGMSDANESPLISLIMLVLFVNFFHAVGIAVGITDEVIGIKSQVIACLCYCPS